MFINREILKKLVSFFEELSIRNESDRNYFRKFCIDILENALVEEECEDIVKDILLFAEINKEFSLKHITTFMFNSIIHFSNVYKDVLKIYNIIDYMEDRICNFLEIKGLIRYWRYFYENEDIIDNNRVKDRFLEYDLSNFSQPHKVRLEIKKHSQLKPSFGDKLVVETKILLPSFGKNNELVPELEFGIRLEIFGEYLNENWGKLAKLDKLSKCYRFKVKKFEGYKWQELLDRAEIYSCKEVLKLLEALYRRRKIVLNA